MNRVKYSQDTLKRVLCTFVFTLFSFFFLYFYQADLMTIIQHVLSEGQTHYNHFVGAVLITIVLLLIQVGVVRLFQRMRLAWAFTFVPSSLLLAMITDVRQSASAANGFLEFGWGGYVLPSCFILFFVVVWILNSSGIAEKYSMNSMNQTRQLWINLALVLLQMLFVCGWSNSDRVLHDRVHVEQCLADNDVDEALLTLQQHSDADENLTMLTAYSLSRKGELPERLFEFPLKGGSAALMAITLVLDCWLTPHSMLISATHICNGCQLCTILTISVGISALIVVLLIICYVPILWTRSLMPLRTTLPDTMR